MKRSPSSLRLRGAVAAILVVFAGAALATPIQVSTAVPVASLPLRTVAAAAPHIGLTRREVENHRRPVPEAYRRAPLHADPVVQSAVGGPKLAVTSGIDFAGIGSNDYGYDVASTPPDTTGAVGTTQYVQWVNTAIAVFDKASGALLVGPVDGNQLFAPLGPTHPCATANDGDPLVLFDRRAQRWVLSQFAVQNPFFQCFAVSQTPDATGTWWLYAFQQPKFNDYGKMGIWRDGYYISYNMFNGDDTYAGARVCAMPRAKMLAGRKATQQCADTDAVHYSLLPADVDGSRQPPAGAPEIFVEIDFAHPNSLAAFTFFADFANVANSTFNGPITIPVAPFTLACGDGGTCIKQPGTTQLLDTLGERLMYRLAYRKRGTVQSLLVNHAVTAGSGVGLRWYELRLDGSSLSVFQQSTFAPADGTAFRWMGSMAMDKTGNIAVGYSAADKPSAVFPSIRASGRLRTDPLNTLQAENTIVAGTGSQKAGVSRWGDYSTMTVDPVDDCTFWYTNEYLLNSGSFNWHTRVASFRFPGCT